MNGRDYHTQNTQVDTIVHGVDSTNNGRLLCSVFIRGSFKEGTINKKGYSKALPRRESLNKYIPSIDESSVSIYRIKLNLPQ